MILLILSPIWEYFKVGAPLTVATIIMGMLLLH